MTRITPIGTHVAMFSTRREGQDALQYAKAAPTRSAAADARQAGERVVAVAREPRLLDIRV